MIRVFHLKFFSKASNRKDFFLLHNLKEPGLSFRKAVEECLEQIEEHEEFDEMECEDKVIWMIGALKRKGYKEIEMLTFPLKTTKDKKLYIDYRQMSRPRKFTT